MRMVVRPQTGSAIVSPASSQSRLMKGMDQRAIVDSEGDMASPSPLFTVADPEEGLAGSAKAMCGAAPRRLLSCRGHQKSDPERRQCLLVEAARALGIRYCKSDMIEHRFPSLSKTPQPGDAAAVPRARRPQPAPRAPAPSPPPAFPPPLVMPPFRGRMSPPVRFTGNSEVH